MAKRQKVNHQAIAPTYERAGVFPFFDLPAEIRNMIYVLIFTTNSFIGHLCADVMQWVFVNFAREYRVIRQFERAMVNKQFWWESMTIFFSMNTFELHAFKALDSFLSHIGPTAASMIKYLRVFPRCDDPFPALCHLSVATGLKRLHIETASLVGEELLRVTLANAKEVILDNHDVLEFYVTDEIFGLVMGPSELDPALLALPFNCRSTPLTKLYDALTNFVFKKLNGEYKARRIKYTTDPKFKYKHIMDGTLKNYGWKLKGEKHYDDIPTTAPEHQLGNRNCGCRSCDRREGPRLMDLLAAGGRTLYG